MNNCPKCGNPLQVGTESCPICGTNISAPAETASASPVVETPAAPVVAEAPAPAPVAETPAAPVVAETPAPTPVAEAPAPDAPTSIEPISIAPTIQTMEAPVPVPSLGTDPSTNIEPTKETKAQAAPTQTKKTKKGLNNKTLLLIIVIVAVVAGGGMLLMGGGTGGGGFVPETPTDETLASSAVSSNGFKFNLKDGWVIHEDGNTVIIRNTDETVAIKLENVDNDFSKISKTTVTSYFSSSASFANTKVEETKISAKDAYLVNTNSGEIPVQVYYINGGTNLTIGATIVYQSKASKDKYEAAVTELIGTISYADDSLKAIDTVQMYSDIFGTYKGVFEHTPSGGTTIEEPTDPTDQQTPQDEETENETEEVEEEPEQEDTVENEEI